MRARLLAALALAMNVLACTPASTGELRTEKTVVLGSAHLLPYVESSIRPAFMEIVAERAPLPDGYFLQATGSGGGMAFLCGIERSLEIARRRGETILIDVDFVVIARPPHPNEIKFCAGKGRPLAFEKIADYRGGLERDVRGAWLVWNASDVRPAARKAMDYILANRAELFGAKSLSKHFKGTSAD